MTLITNHKDGGIEIAKKEHILYNLKWLSSTPLDKPQGKTFN
jgi:hypothetical protein